MMAGWLRMVKLTKASAVKARTRPSTNSQPSSWQPTQPYARHCRA
jgi:hypothetical protein